MPIYAKQYYAFGLMPGKEVELQVSDEPIVLEEGFFPPELVIPTLLIVIKTPDTVELYKNKTAIAKIQYTPPLVLIPQMSLETLTPETLQGEEINEKDLKTPIGLTGKYIKILYRTNQ